MGKLDWRNTGRLAAFRARVRGWKLRHCRTRRDRLRCRYGGGFGDPAGCRRERPSRDGQQERSDSRFRPHNLRKPDEPVPTDSQTDRYISSPRLLVHPSALAQRQRRRAAFVRGSAEADRVAGCRTHQAAREHHREAARVDLTLASEFLNRRLPCDPATPSPDRVLARCPRRSIESSRASCGTCRIHQCIRRSEEQRHGS